MAVLPGARVLVVGLGVSGAAAARALVDAGVAVRAVDAGAAPAVVERADALRAAGADVRLGVRAGTGLLDDRDWVVTSPGVPQDGPVLSAARARGLPVWSEPELAWRLAAGAGDAPATRLVAVTGTNGKTTTTELLAACLRAPAAGNIGTPLVEALRGPDAPPLVVAELSSFQLRFTRRLRADVGVVLNVAPDHLDWHGSLPAYRAAKARVWANQRPDRDWAVAGVDDRGVRDLLAAHPPPAGLVAFTSGPPGPGQVGVADGRVVWRPPAEWPAGVAPVDVVATDDLGARGPHNLANALAAVAAAVCAGADPGTLAAPLRAFRAGPHRLERVATIDGIAYVDDSKATNPHAAAAALASYGDPAAGPGRLVWIAGGLNKGLAFDDLAGPVRERVRVACTIGSAGPQIAAFVRGLGVAVVEAGDLTTAVRAAARAAVPGDTVLLAPACASMDQFADYAERGRAFRQAVAALPRAGGHDRTDQEASRAP